MDNDFKLDLRVQMPTREKPEQFSECTWCQSQHDPDGPCEGVGMDARQPVAYEVPQVEESSYLKQALARFKKKRKKKQLEEMNAKD